MRIVKKNKNKKRNKYIAYFVPSIVNSMILIILSIVLLVLSSIILINRLWLSNAMLSISCGIITGVIIYVLTNVRNASYNKTKYEYELLLETQAKSKDIVRDSKFYIKYHCTWDDDMDQNEFFRRVFDAIEGLQSVLFEKLSWELYKEIGLEENNPIDYDFTEELLEHYGNLASIDGEIDELLNLIVKRHESLILMLMDSILSRKEKLSLYNRFNL